MNIRKIVNDALDRKWVEKNRGIDMSEEDVFKGLAKDIPCRTCGDPDDFTSGLERCDDDPCELLKEYRKAKQSPTASPLKG